jgi:hypothetical protein
MSNQSYATAGYQAPKPLVVRILTSKNERHGDELTSTHVDDPAKEAHERESAPNGKMTKELGDPLFQSGPLWEEFQHRFERHRAAWQLSTFANPGAVRILRIRLVRNRVRAL